VIEEWTSLFPALLKITLEDMSAMPLHGRPLHAPGMWKAEIPGLSEAFHLSQLLIIAGL